MNVDVVSLGNTSSSSQLDRFDAYKAHVLDRIERVSVGCTPFFHVYVEGIFPGDLYAAIMAKVLHYRNHQPLTHRLQDNQAFANERYNLVENDDVETTYIRALFADEDVKRALLKKFFVNPHRSLVQKLSIHEEFEYVYTAKNRFQNVHIDIPAKFLSLVFYFPTHELTEEEQRLNSTILYDKELKPHYQARYRENSVCVFAPHFYTYHGFSTTIERTALVMFYVDKELVTKHQQIVREAKAAKRLDAFKDTVQTRLEAHPLLEYDTGAERIQAERKQCLINAPRGRVMRDSDL